MDFTRFEEEYKISNCPLFRHCSHGFVTWVVFNDLYVQGALVLGSSLRHYSSGILRVCLLERKLSREENVKHLQLVFDKVVIVDPIIAEGVYRRGKRFDTLYRDWIHHSFTRLHCLRLGNLLGLQKIIIFDADTLVLRDISSLFELPAPAGILSLPQGHSLFNGIKMNHEELHGKIIPESYIDHAINHSYGIRGCLLILKPSEDDYNNLINLLKQNSSTHNNAIGAYGNESYFLGPDEKLFTDYYNKRWTHIHEKYCMTAWHFNRLEKNQVPICLHYVSQKPWNIEKSFYDDFNLWYLELLHLLSHSPELKNRFKNSALSHDIQHFSGLTNCQSQFFISLSRRIKSPSNFQNVLKLLKNYHGTTIFNSSNNSTHLKTKVEKICNKETDYDKDFLKNNQDISLKITHNVCNMDKPLMELEQFKPLLYISNSSFPLVSLQQTALPATNISNSLPAMPLNNFKKTFHDSNQDNEECLKNNVDINRLNGSRHLLCKALSDIQKQSFRLPPIIYKKQDKASKCRSALSQRMFL